jgi:hypothetical protein
VVRQAAQQLPLAAQKVAQQAVHQAAQQVARVERQVSRLPSLQATLRVEQLAAVLLVPLAAR